MKLFQNLSTDIEEVLKSFFVFIALVATLFIAKPFEQFLVEGKPRNISVKLFPILYTDIAEEVIKSLFLFIALVAILFNIAESFEQFW